MAKTPKRNITTIKIEKQTKLRLDGIKEHHRETYNELINKMLNIINITIKSPVTGARILRNIKKKKSRQNQSDSLVYQSRNKEQKDNSED